MINLIGELLRNECNFRSEEIRHDKSAYCVLLWKIGELLRNECNFRSEEIRHDKSAEV